MSDRGKKQLGAEEKSATVDPTHLMHIEREVSALMDECESIAHKQRQKVAMNRERSQRKTMQRVKQRQKLKKSQRMRRNP